MDTKEFMDMEKAVFDRDVLQASTEQHSAYYDGIFVSRLAGEYLKLKNYKTATETTKNTGGTMKAYKIDLSGYTGLEREVISKAVQEKAFELGYRWRSGEGIQYSNQKYLFFNGYDNSICVCHGDDEYYPTYKNTAITVPDFLALKSAKDDEKPAHTFKPFDRVLVRDSKYCEWMPSLFFKMGERDHYETLWGEPWNQCIPYEGNEELIGTNKEPSNG